jgi:hypothetical protein
MHIVHTNVSPSTVQIVCALAPVSIFMFYVMLHSCMQYEYLWADGVKVKKPVKLTAPQYIEALFDWIEDQVCP